MENCPVMVESSPPVIDPAKAQRLFYRPPALCDYSQNVYYYANIPKNTGEENVFTWFS
jgi:hypothetical protein